jgi:7,8-dihydropterin-6-yl-methyl-4-(beta-D-ribofuranosyl)aminobenzene 5'-phosphate synthase
VRWLPDNQPLQRLSIALGSGNMNIATLKRVSLAEVDGVEVLSLVDNAVDFLSTTDKKEVQSFRQWTRKRIGKEAAMSHTLPFAEHGFSMLIRVLQGGKSTSILFDTGCSSEGVIVNAERMGVDLKEVECIVLSHGHYDHTGGLLSALNAIGKADLPVIAHKDVFKTRGTANPDGTVRAYPEFPTKEQLKEARLIETKQPLLVAADTVLVTGEIPRETSFEKGYLKHKALVKGTWQSDPWIWDDQAIAVNVKGKGLVVLSGCAHAGIINTVRYAQRVTSVADVCAVIGGFHLAGKDCEGRIGQSVEEMRRISPGVVVPCHCTGWRAKFALAVAMPDAFVWNSVGNLYRL